MNKLMTVTAALTFAATGAFAQSGTVNGAVGGAVTGAIVGGPVGAAVGGVAGAIIGTAIDPPPSEVVTYVQQQPAPAQRVRLEQQIVVGKPIPQSVVLTPVPSNPKYAYTVVNDQRVIVDPRTHTVVQVLN
ncbi:protein of unknown function DUF1236 [Rhizobium sp. CF080]|uniref:DUF1236 domain-containing protein n=1 Tax=Rhizobium sp. (strain CF080) TaxID=1144310 RepID=UPI00027166F7|nr:DUF1236 domain-containing protein [Rhizobium sp. CF080]EUB98060.1 protein of unknown function DUF1236 [Rhizobium sp. CF080]